MAAIQLTPWYITTKMSPTEFHWFQIYSFLTVEEWSQTLFLITVDYSISIATLQVVHCHEKPKATKGQSFKFSECHTMYTDGSTLYPVHEKINYYIWETRHKSYRCVMGSDKMGQSWSHFWVSGAKSWAGSTFYLLIQCIYHMFLKPKKSPWLSL